MLRYAQGSRGVVLVIDIDPADPQLAAKLTRELWLVRGASRFMLWGRFDECLAAIIPAKDLRAQLRLRGVRDASDETKAIFLRGFIARELRDQQLRSQFVPRSDVAPWATLPEHGRVNSHER